MGPQTGPQGFGIGFTVALGNIRQLNIGRFEFRKRIPERHRERLGQGEFKRRFVAYTASEIAREHARIADEYVRLIAEGTPTQAQDTPSPQLQPANVTTTQRALPPAPTLAQAADRYLRDRLEMGRNNQATNTFHQALSRLEDALKVRREDVAVTDLTRHHARTVRDYMLSLQKRDGSPLSPASVKRDMNVLTAMLNHTLEEFELSETWRNPFKALPTAAKFKASPPAAERRDYLPDIIVSAMTSRLTGDLQIIWRLLAGTGCRLAEITGLRLEDVEARGEAPHLKITWHERRRLKTASSIRLVPLVSDALDAAVEATKLPRASHMLFERYAHPRGPDAASAILMKYMRGLTKNRQYVVHSLRHRMKDKLRLAGVPKDVQDFILGHASASVAEQYGRVSARLSTARRAMTKAAEC